MRKIFLITVFTSVMSVTSAVLAGTNSYCGKKSTVEGAAVLVNDQDREILQLAEQGGDQSLLKQANQLLGNRMKEGEPYCLTVMVNAGGTPIKVLKARPDLLAKGRKTVVPPPSPTDKMAPVPDEKKPEVLKEVPAE